MTRSDLFDMIALAERLRSAGETAVLATLFCAHGSTYRPLGSMMVSGPGSMAAGGVSGGCVEEYVARHGRMLVEGGAGAMLSFDADPDGDGMKPSLGCGGSIEVLVERITPDHVEFLRRVEAAQRADVASTPACVVNTENAGAINVRRVWLDGSAATNEASLEPLRLAARETERGRHGVLDASRRALVHYIPPMTRLVLLGAGDDVRPLCTMARSLGWHVTVADRRGRLATPARFPEADVVTSADWATVIGGVMFTPRTAVVMLTHSIADDAAILPLLADKPMAYVGALGPPHRRQWVLDGASEFGPLSENFAARFRGPIGLNLGDRSPAGIAVSIVAEILATLNVRDAVPLFDSAAGALPAQAHIPSRTAVAP